LRKKDTGVQETLSDSLIEANRMRVVEIQAVKSESPSVKSIFFKDDLCAKAKAGQFLMVWVPGVDEIPLSLSSMNSGHGLSSVTVAEVGEATRTLNQMKIGDQIGVRGPFGNHFEMTGGRAIVVGGGIGTAPLMPLIEDLLKEHLNVTVLIGAITGSELLFPDRLKLIRGIGKIIVTTDDGSCGAKGLVTDALYRILSSERFDNIYACGPEKMMYKAYLLSEQYQTPLQASLERMMRCALGICGSCVIGKYRVCRDGPIFTTNQLREVKKEFGVFKRGFNGRKTAV